MRTLTYSINVTLDGCIDHREGRPDAEVRQLAPEALAQAGGPLLGRVTFELMEQSWRPPASDAFPDWMQPFAHAIQEIPKYVALTTLESVGWNTEQLGGDLRESVRELKGRPGDRSASEVPPSPPTSCDGPGRRVRLHPLRLGRRPRPLPARRSPQPPRPHPDRPPRPRLRCRRVNVPANGSERLKQLRPPGPRHGGAGRHRGES